MTTNPETLNSELENSELLQTKEELSSLKKEVKEGVEPSITKGPYEKDGAIIFDYEKSGQKWEIVTRKDGDTYKIRVKKWTKLPNGKMGWQTQKNGNSETFNFTASDKTSFNKGLGNALNKVIGANRDKLPKTGGKVYDMLNVKNNKKTNKESNKKTEQKESKETNQMPKGLELDHGTYVYTVQKGDSESVIKSKLKKYAPLSYLKDISDGINGRNFTTIPDKKLLPGLKLVVPKKDSEKIKTVSGFKEFQKSALNEMKDNSTYGSYIKNLIKKFGERHIENVMTAYAKSETCPEDYDNKVGKFALFRYEDYYKCPSYGYHHVLYMDAGLRAFNKTGITIGQCCNPKNSGKLFLAFCIEKSKDNYRKFFDLENKENLKWASYRYNGPKYKDNNYDTKLKNNYKKAKES